jgi:hypothetical protein
MATANKPVNIGTLLEFVATSGTSAARATGFDTGHFGASTFAASAFGGSDFAGSGFAGTCFGASALGGSDLPLERVPSA